MNTLLEKVFSEKSYHWDEIYKSTLIKMIENSYKNKITNLYGISDISILKDKILLKWYKREDWLIKKEYDYNYEILVKIPELNLEKWIPLYDNELEILKENNKFDSLLLDNKIRKIEY